MRIRNPFTIRARQRKAGPMKHRNAERGGARRSLTLEVPGLTFTCPCGTEHEAALPYRTARVQHAVGVCDDCLSTVPQVSPHGTDTDPDAPTESVPCAVCGGEISPLAQEIGTHRCKVPTV